MTKLKTIKLKTIYRTSNDYYIVILRYPKYKYYVLYGSVCKSNLEDFDYLLNECNPLFSAYYLSDVRYFARKYLDGKDFFTYYG